MQNIPLQAEHYLFAVLNWGLGHASRSIAVIEYLLQHNKKITLASDGIALELLKQEFPTLPTIELPSYNIRYGKSIYAILFGNSPNVLKAIIHEKMTLNKLVRQNAFDCIISDSRFGFFHRKVPSYIISHQLHIPAKPYVLFKILNAFNHFFLNRFEKVLVPDASTNLLSGKLSRPQGLKRIAYIGPVSRLSRQDQKQHKYDLCICLSGPEPARSILEGKLLKLLKHEDYKVILIRGTQKPIDGLPKHWETIALANRAQLNDIFTASNLIVSRAGYTSIMDYYILNKKAIIIPTPGQMEQEYLAEHLNGNHGLSSLSEEELHRLPELINARLAQ